MMDKQTPESMGLSSAIIERYLRTLEEEHLATHDVIIARGNSILFETYVAPFQKNDTHRMYSVTKSLVALAVGFALDDGLLSLDDPVEKYFAAELEGQTDENFRRQTIRQMMMMSTAKPAPNWFVTRAEDRVRGYFANPDPRTRPAGSFFEYDSTGTFVVGSLIERLTGMRLMAYLRLKLFDKIGVSESVRCLTCPGGHSWSDSAALMTPRDLLLCARFTLNGGSWNGEQLISADYIREATSRLIPTGLDENSVEGQGYGYYIWKTWGDGFFFNGMGCQFAVCVPEKDLILIYNGDNQGNSHAIVPIIHGFFDQIVSAAQDEPLPEDPAAQQSLEEFASGLKLVAAWKEPDSPMKEKIAGKTFRLGENPMGMETVRFTFSGNSPDAVFAYRNAQGDKLLPFGLCENRFGYFPQEGYSDEIGSKPGGKLYRCAASGAWEGNTLWLKVQLIDDYFGNFDAWFRFSEDGSRVSVEFRKTAEDFLNEYQGKAEGIAE